LIKPDGIPSNDILNFFFQERMLQFLQKLKEKGKKLFLLTNSPFYFVDGGMSYMLEVFFTFVQMYDFICINHWYWFELPMFFDMHVSLEKKNQQFRLLVWIILNTLLILYFSTWCSHYWFLLPPFFWVIGLYSKR
jgi:5' nucleotidase family